MTATTQINLGKIAIRYLIDGSRTGTMGMFELPAEQAWKAKTDALMQARERAMERYADILRQRGYNDLTRDELRQATVDMFERAKANNKVLRTVVEASNKSSSCGNALGAMNASSFSFEQLAPNSYAYWTRNFKP